MILDIIIALFAIIFIAIFIVVRIIKFKKNGISSLCSGNCKACSNGCNKKGSS